MGKKIGFAAVVVIIVFAVTQMFFRVPGVQERMISYTDDDFVDANIYSNIEELAARLDEEILGGEESFTVYLKDMDISEIDDINHSLTGIYGSGATYQQVGMAGADYKKVVIRMKRNTNYYVLKAFREKAPIPEEDREARVLYNMVRGVIDTYIKPGMTDYEKELALHDYVVSHCHYSENENQEPGSDIYRAYGALVNEEAVCNGYAEALKLMFDCIGLESKFVVGTADGIDHAWNLVKLGECWYHLDATWDDPLPDQGEKVIHPYFNVSDEVLSNNHTWDKKNYPAAMIMRYNYYVYNDQYFSSFDTYKTYAYEEMVQHGNNWYEAVVEYYDPDNNTDDMQFIFQGSFRYSTVSWQTFESGKYHVLVLEAE